MDLGRLEEPLRLGVVTPQQIGMGKVVGRFALEIGDDKRGLGLEETVALALLQVPVVQACQKHLVGRVGNDTIRLVLPLGDDGHLAVDIPGIGRCQIVHCDHNLRNQVVTLFSEIKVVLAGILGASERVDGLGLERSRHLFRTTIHDPGQGEVGLVGAAGDVQGELNCTCGVSDKSCYSQEKRTRKELVGNVAVHCRDQIVHRQTIGHLLEQVQTLVEQVPAQLRVGTSLCRTLQ